MRAALRARARPLGPRRAISNVANPFPARSQHRPNRAVPRRAAAKVIERFTAPSSVRSALCNSISEMSDALMKRAGLHVSMPDALEAARASYLWWPKVGSLAPAPASPGRPASRAPPRLPAWRLPLLRAAAPHHRSLARSLLPLPPSSGGDLLAALDGRLLHVLPPRPLGHRSLLPRAVGRKALRARAAHRAQSRAAPEMAAERRARLWRTRRRQRRRERRRERQRQRRRRALLPAGARGRELGRARRRLVCADPCWLDPRRLHAARLVRARLESAHRAAAGHVAAARHGRLGRQDRRDVRAARRQPPPRRAPAPLPCRR